MLLCHVRNVLSTLSGDEGWRCYRRCPSPPAPPPPPKTSAVLFLLFSPSQHIISRQGRKAGKGREGVTHLYSASMT